MEAIILAGGMGTRLRSVIQEVPKPMADISGKPFLCYILDYLDSFKIGRVVLSLGYKHQVVSNYFGEHYRSIDLIYSIENEPLGTGGAIKKALNNCHEEDVIILNGDSFFNVNLIDMFSRHKETKADLTIALKEMSHFDRYGTVQINDGRIESFLEKKYMKDGMINGGIYLLKRSILNNSKLPEKFSFESEFLQIYYKDLFFGAYISQGYFIDIGIPEDYRRAKSELMHNV